MNIFFKILITTALVCIILEIAKNHSELGGLLIAMPLNIIISLIFLYKETGNTKLLSNFTFYALWGIFPTVAFLLSMIFMLNKNLKFNTGLVLSILIWTTFVIIQNMFISKIDG